MWKESQKKELLKVFKNIPPGKRYVEKPRKRWLDDENNLKKMGVRGWRKIAKPGN